MKKVYMYTNHATLLGFNNYINFQKKMLIGSLQSLAEACSEVNIKEYGDYKNFSAETMMLDPTLRELIVM